MKHCLVCYPSYLVHATNVTIVEVCFVPRGNNPDPALQAQQAATTPSFRPLLPWTLRILAIYRTLKIGRNPCDVV